MNELVRFFEFFLLLSPFLAAGLYGIRAFSRRVEFYSSSPTTTPLERAVKAAATIRKWQFLLAYVGAVTSTIGVALWAAAWPSDINAPIGRTVDIGVFSTFTGMMLCLPLAYTRIVFNLTTADGDRDKQSGI